MRINIFEGARRVAFLVSGIAVLVAAGMAFNTEPYIVTDFRITGPGETPVATSMDCDFSSPELSFEATTPKGRKTWVNVCLVADQLAMDDGTTQGFVRLPDGADGKPSWAYGTSPLIEPYKKSVQASFRLPRADGIKADQRFEAKLREGWVDIAKGLAITMLVFWLGVAAIGWIVRGFAGIPRGKDARPKSEET